MENCVKKIKVIKKREEQGGEIPLMVQIGRGRKSHTQTADEAIDKLSFRSLINFTTLIRIGTCVDCTKLNLLIFCEFPKKTPQTSFQ